MDEVGPLLQWAKASLTIGGVGIWTLVFMAAGIWWKGLPAIIEAYTKRTESEHRKANEDREETRREMARLHQLHIDCEERVRKLTDDYDKRLNKAFDQIDDLRCQLAGLLAQKGQMALSTAEQLARLTPGNDGAHLLELATRADNARRAMKP